MGIFDGILICTDLDGTLYKNDKTISKRNKDAIEFFKSEGGSFTFVTGRLPYYSKDAFLAVVPNVPFGCINGGGLYDGRNERYIWTRDLPHEAMELVGYIDERFPGLGIQICCFEKTYFARENETTDRFRRITGLERHTCDYKSVNELDIAKVIFCSDDGDQVLAIKDALRHHEKAYNFDFIRSEYTFFEILPKGVNKGLALTKLAEHLGIDQKRTIAVGDYDNDVAMLRAAGCGIAVSNASRAALDAADFITVSNEEDAIAEIIDDLKSGKYIT